MLVNKILSNDFVSLQEEANEHISNLLARKLVEMKQQMAYAKYDLDEGYELVEDEVNEASVVKPKSGKRWKIVRVRIRKGKIQRNHKVDMVPGYKMNQDQFAPVRMSPEERRNRRRGQKRGKVKRKAKMSQSRMKYKRSMRKRAAMGI